MHVCCGYYLHLVVVVLEAECETATAKVHALLGSIKARVRRKWRNSEYAH